MGTLAEIEQATKHYADHRELLKLRVSALNDEIEEIKRRYLPEIKTAAADTANAKAALESLIDDSRHLFVKPKSLIISGIKVGLKKGSGSVEFEDEGLVIKLIKKHFPEKEWELYIKTTEKVRKTPLETLDAALLKKLGVTLEGTSDVVLVKAVDSEVDKLVTAMLKEAAGDDGERDAA
ncbi:host-nuclease inhibitor Gam family protein [Geobacter sp.]|uniref:host-nuclease inhibitor Gam family protein n=1 Tax=Geobacter sp. TaxID=46610 RepID=UPI0026221257|nr:host-nuclease inhibitor Gam family protein [Geobacter sp.]